MNPKSISWWNPQTHRSSHQKDFQSGFDTQTRRFSISLMHVVMLTCKKWVTKPFPPANNLSSPAQDASSFLVNVPSTGTANKNQKLHTTPAKQSALLSPCVVDNTLPFDTLLQTHFTFSKCPFDSSNTDLTKTLGSSVIPEDDSTAIASANDGNENHPNTKHPSSKMASLPWPIKQRWLKVKKIATKINWADIFAKPLPQPHFEIFERRDDGLAHSWRTRKVPWQTTP